MDKELSQKHRIFYLYKYLVENTDSEHTITTMQLIRWLKATYDIDVNRNTLCNDLKIMEDCGLQIHYYPSTQNKYYFDGQVMDDVDVEMLISEVRASKGLTAQKAKKLTEKILSMTRKENAEKIRESINWDDFNRADNQSVPYIIDAINKAIKEKKKIKFYYTEYNMLKEKRRTNNGEAYTVSPFRVVWNDGYYYLRGFCDERKEFRTFRVDRIDGIPKTTDEKVTGRKDKHFERFNKEVFSMFDSARPVDVVLLCRDYTMKSMIDAFGKDIKTEIVDNTHFKAYVRVCPSSTFFRWVFGFGEGMKILDPYYVVKDFKKMLRTAVGMYKGEN